MSFEEVFKSALGNSSLGSFYDSGDISGNYAVSGDVYGHLANVYEKVSDGNWKLIQQIVPDDVQPDTFFGASVSISGNYIIVGAPKGYEHNLAGSVYVFELQADGSWMQYQKIMPVKGDRSFGSSVAISGDYIIVGASEDGPRDPNSTAQEGAAYIYERIDGGEWKFAQKLSDLDRMSSGYFGVAVAISNNYALVGAHWTDKDSGAAYMFERSMRGNWLLVQKLIADDREEYELFGRSVSISGKYAIIGAPFESENIPLNDNQHGRQILAGAAYIFERGRTGNWKQVQKLVSSDRSGGDLFGNVSISGDYAIVSATLEDKGIGKMPDKPVAGAAYIFQRGEDGYWSEIQKIVPSDRSTNNSTAFGTKVAIWGKNALVISMHGNCYIYEQRPNRLRNLWLPAAFTVLFVAIVIGTRIIINKRTIWTNKPPRPPKPTDIRR